MKSEKKNTRELYERDTGIKEVGRGREKEKRSVAAEILTHDTDFFGSPCRVAASSNRAFISNSCRHAYVIIYIKEKEQRTVVR